MSKLKLTGKDLRAIGFPEGRVVGIALSIALKHYKRQSKTAVMATFSNLLENPEAFLEDDLLSAVADLLVEQPPAAASAHPSIAAKAKEFPIFGKDGIEEGALHQMYTAMRLPVTVAGALMPDAHQGYGLPIGGVLATENAVIPYGVGVDIGCRMCLSVFDLSPDLLLAERQKFLKILQENTRFGQAEFDDPMDDPLFERPEFREIKLLKGLRDRAFRQVGSSGSGNHFVEFGAVELADPNNEFGLPCGKYLALLSHSGSRNLGATIANHFTKVAMEKCVLPKEAKHLAWLSLDAEEGQEYWQAMNLAGDYASANHHHIHRRIAKKLGAKTAFQVENHHNFAWKEHLPDGKEVIVHRKGATPAGKGVLGIIPGSMTAPGFIIRGKGNFESLQSASHGAGRVLSRTAAKQSLTQKILQNHLEEHGVTLIGGGLDEAPMAYKNIHTVMEAQQELVEIVGIFEPKIVRMDG